MGDGNRANGASGGLHLWELKTELRRLHDLQNWHQAGTEKEIARLDKRIQANARELEALNSSIGSAIRWLAIGACAIIFELLRKGTVF